MKINKILLSCALAIVTIPAFAWTTVNITNNTKQSCSLERERFDMVHGRLVYPTGMVKLMPGVTLDFILYPDDFGPDMIATLKCGGKIVRFESEQTLGTFMSGEPVATPLAAQSPLKLSSTQTNGRRILNLGAYNSGTINWTISSK